MKINKQSKLEIGFLIFLLVAFSLMLPSVITMKSDTTYTIGPGFLPSVMLIVSMVCCVIILVGDIVGILKNRNKGTVEEASPDESKEKQGFSRKNGMVRVFMYLLAAVVLILGMEFVGIIASIVVMTFAVLFFIEQYKWFASLRVAVIFGALIYLVFVVWLGVPLPILNWL